jgi:hypothetical protein
VHLRTAAIVEPANKKEARGTSARWLVSAADVGDDGSEKPRLHVPTVAAMGRGRRPNTRSSQFTRQPYGLPWSTRASACQNAATA